MFWHNEQEEKALADWRAQMRKERQLKKELLELQQVAHNPRSQEQFIWALQMIKSIKHELEELQS